MKKIVLIGDSIRLGYEAYVRSAFQGIAEVYAPRKTAALPITFSAICMSGKALASGQATWT